LPSAVNSFHLAQRHKPAPITVTQEQPLEDGVVGCRTCGCARRSGLGTSHGCGKAVGLDGLEQVVQCVDLERPYRVLVLYPNLAGQKSEYLVAQLRAFRDGNRTNPIMSPMASHLSDMDIENLAAYYSALK